MRRVPKQMSAKPKVRFWVIGPLLVYLFVFLLWFPRWQHAPQSHSARMLGALFLVLTAVWAIPSIVGVLWYGNWANPGLRDLVQLVTDIYETFFKKDLGTTPAATVSAMAHPCAMDRPSLVITKRLKNGTPIRGACPLCDVEFSTEAFDRERGYPHERTLDAWYEEHFQDHIAAGDTT